MKEYTYDIEGKGKGKAGEIPDDLRKSAEELHEKLIEAAAESDDSLMEKYFDSGLTPEEISIGVKKAIIERTLFPIIFTDAETNIGIDLFMKLWETGKTILMITHEADVAGRCERKIELLDGRIIDN